MEVKVSNLEKISLIIFSVTIFLGYMIYNLYILLAIATLIVLIPKLILKKIKLIDINEKIWILILFISFISIVYSIDREESFKFFFMIFCCYLFKISFQDKETWGIYLINLFYVLSGVHVIATLIMKVNPQVIILINRFILKGENLVSNLQQFNLGYYPGITGQVGVNVFYIAIFCLISICKILLNNKRKIMNIGMLFFAIMAMILTGKRGMLICTMISSIFIIILLLKVKVVKVRHVLYIVGIILFFTIIFSQLDIFHILIDKFGNLNNASDISNGRIDLWKGTFNNFKKSPILGTGMNTIGKLVGDLTHNVYIQLLSDVGIVGFLSFVFLFVFNISLSIRKIVKNNYNIYYLLVSLYIQLLFLIYCFFGNPLYGPIFFMPYTIMITLTNSCSNLKVGD